MKKRVLKSEDYTNLRDKNIFDFCDDKAILEEVTGIAEKEEYFKYCEPYEHIRWKHLLYLAEEIGDKEFEKAVTDEFAEEIQRMFDE